MKLSNCLLLCLFEASLFLLWSVAVDNSSLSSNSTFLAAESVVQQIGDKLQFLNDGSVQLNVDSGFFLEVFAAKGDDKALIFCFKAKKAKSSIEKCPEHYCQLLVQFTEITDMPDVGFSVYVLLGNVARAIEHANHVKIEIHENIMILNNGTLTSTNCTWDKQIGFLEAKLFRKNLKMVYLKNATAFMPKNNTTNSTSETAVATAVEITGGKLAGVIIAGIVGVVLVIGGIGGIIYYCKHKKGDENKKGVALKPEEMASTRSSTKTAIEMEGNKVEQHATTAPVVQDAAVQEVPTTNTEEKKSEEKDKQEEKVKPEEIKQKEVKQEVKQDDVKPNVFIGRKNKMKNEHLYLYEYNPRNDHSHNIVEKQTYFTEVFQNMKMGLKIMEYGFKKTEQLQISTTFQKSWKENFHNEWFTPVKIVNLDFFFYFHGLGILQNHETNAIVSIFNCYGHFQELEQKIFTSFEDFKEYIKKIRSEKSFLKELEITRGNFTEQLKMADMEKMSLSRQLLIIYTLFKDVFNCFEMSINNPIIFLAPPSVLFVLALKKKMEEKFLIELYFLMIYRGAQAFPHIGAIDSLQKQFPLGALAYCFYIQDKCRFSDYEQAENVVLAAKKTISYSKDNFESKVNLQIEKAKEAIEPLIASMYKINIVKDESATTPRKQTKEFTSKTKPNTKGDVTQQNITVDKTQTKISTEQDKKTKESKITVDRTQNEENDKSLKLEGTNQKESTTKGKTTTKNQSTDQNVKNKDVDPTQGTQ
uniref:Uncharacterized protein n=1 Tax=Panagrolaimus sp. JU765 TaxID=591449 RepID=A0AC34QD18_9BILA